MFSVRTPHEWGAYKTSYAANNILHYILHSLATNTTIFENDGPPTAKVCVSHLFCRLKVACLQAQTKADEKRALAFAYSNFDCSSEWQVRSAMRREDGGRFDLQISASECRLLAKSSETLLAFPLYTVTHYIDKYPPTFDPSLIYVELNATTLAPLMSSADCDDYEATTRIMQLSASTRGSKQTFPLVCTRLPTAGHVTYDPNERCVFDILQST